MQKTSLGKILAGLSLVAALTPAQAEQKIKCWTNEDGIRECGSVIPPQYAPKEHDVIDPKGSIILDKVEAQKSEEEIKAIKRREAEEKARKEEEERKLAEGKALLDAYPTEDDIELSRSGKQASVQAAIDVANNQLAFFKKSLTEAENAAKIKSTPELVRHIENLKQQISKFEGIIADKHLEQQKIEEEYKKVLQKYRDYKEFLAQSRSRPTAEAAGQNPQNPAENPAAPAP